MPDAWAWCDGAYEALATGRVDLRRGGTATLVGEPPDSGWSAVRSEVRVRPVGLAGSRVARAGRLTRWAFEDLQFGPRASADGIRGVVVAQGAVLLACLAFARTYDVVDGVFTVVVDPDGVLTLGNRGT